MTFITFQKNTYEVANSVYFDYDSREAETRRKELSKSNPEIEWAVAVVLENEWSHAPVFK